jgi:hypothetical protein
VHRSELELDWVSKLITNEKPSLLALHTSSFCGARWNCRAVMDPPLIEATGIICRFHTTTPGLGRKLGPPSGLGYTVTG